MSNQEQDPSLSPEQFRTLVSLAGKGIEAATPAPAAAPAAAPEGVSASVFAAFRAQNPERTPTSDEIFFMRGATRTRRSRLGGRTGK